MNRLEIKYRTAGKAFAPQPVQWVFSGSDIPQSPHMEGGESSQLRGHVSFREAAAYGLELIYQYRTECHVVNESGDIRIDWDWAQEPGGALGWDEFSETAPKPSIAFLFATSVDLQAPPGHVLRIEPHPRFFTDDTGTVAPAMGAHVRTEWWAKKLFVAFKVPPPGHRYVFRHGEPYAQILFVPQDRIFEPVSLNTVGSASPTSVDVRYRTTGIALPPQPIRLAIPGWSGCPEMKRKNGSEPQPWHCPPFREGSTYGLELLYPFDSECRVINDDGRLRFETDLAQEAAGASTDKGFVSGPEPGSYSFATSLELQAPAGHVLRTVPHPRFFTDRSGTVPLARCGHSDTDEPGTLRVAFKAPAPGQRHVFRKGEAYVQIHFVPKSVIYDTKPMSAEEETDRSSMERGLLLANAHIARNVWHNPKGLTFNDHYSVLEHVFKHDGLAGVRTTIEEAVERHRRTVPEGRTIAEYLDLASEYRREGKNVEAKETLIHAGRVDPNDPEVWNSLGLFQWTLGLHERGLASMQTAVRLQPNSAVYCGNLGEMLRQMGCHQEAIAALRISMQLDPNDEHFRTSLELAVRSHENPGTASDCETSTLTTP